MLSVTLRSPEIGAEYIRNLLSHRKIDIAHHLQWNRDWKFCRNCHQTLFCYQSPATLQCRFFRWTKRTSRVNNRIMTSRSFGSLYLKHEPWMQLMFISEKMTNCPGLSQPSSDRRNSRGKLRKFEQNRATRDFVSFALLSTLPLSAPRASGVKDSSNRSKVYRRLLGANQAAKHNAGVEYSPSQVIRTNGRKPATRIPIYVSSHRPNFRLSKLHSANSAALLIRNSWHQRF